MIKEKEVIKKTEWDKPISNDNVKDFGECLALKVLKTSIEEKIKFIQ